MIIEFLCLHVVDVFSHFLTTPLKFPRTDTCSIGCYVWDDKLLICYTHLGLIESIIISFNDYSYSMLFIFWYHFFQCLFMSYAIYFLLSFLIQYIFWWYVIFFCYHLVQCLFLSYDIYFMLSVRLFWSYIIVSIIISFHVAC